MNNYSKARKSTLKTYSYLADQKRIPSLYDINTSKLLYYTEKEIGIETPALSWFNKYRGDNNLSFTDLEAFRDPRETTYATYVSRQKEKEAYLLNLLPKRQDKEYESRISQEWIDILDTYFSPLVYPFHGLQMIAGYLGQMAPTGRLVILSTFQAADEMRKIQQIAYLTAQIRISFKQFGCERQMIWEKNSAWQPLRKLIEELLVVYRWEQSFVALNLCVKPVIDMLFLKGFESLSNKHSDHILGYVLESLYKDTEWHEEWVTSLFKYLIGVDLKNLNILRTHYTQWKYQIIESIYPFEKIFGSPFPSLLQAIDNKLNYYDKILTV